MSDKINIIVDSLESKKFKTDSDTKSARNPFEGVLKKSAASTLSFEVGTIKENIESTCKAIIEAISSIDHEDSKFEIEKASFNLVFDAKGGVSIMSSVSTEMNVQTGLTITLQPKK